MPTEGVWVSPSGQKVVIPLENNPEVFTSLVHDLGVSKELGYFDVYSLDEPSLLAMVPRPAHALIFITPSPMYNAVRDSEEAAGSPVRRIDKHGLTYDGAGDAEPVLWFQQTIGNACGLMALIHAVANGPARAHIRPGSLLDRLIAEATPLSAVPRAAVLYDSQELEEVHMKAARGGDSYAPGADEPAGHHFIAYVKGKDGHLWELEGGTDGPVDCGPLPEDADMLSEQALDQGVRRFMKFADGNLEFSIVALAEGEAA